MATDRTQEWLNVLGYSNRASLHRDAEAVPAGHGYALELRALLDPDGLIQAQAVFDVDGIPTVCFFDADGRSAGWMDLVRERIWNQNLVSMVLVVEDRRIVAHPVLPDSTSKEAVSLENANDDGPFSALDVQSGDVWGRHQEWFNPAQRVDRHLLKNLDYMVKRLVEAGLPRGASQFLLGQALFVSYLEARGVVGDVYRQRRGVGRIHDLIGRRDNRGLQKLFSQLKKDFNGDFLDPIISERAGWANLPISVYGHLNEFLARVDLESGQRSLWSYDFRFIPVELISGIYETFLNEEQEELGAYYTPRHLANLVVDLAFAESADPSREIVYDGACGSGILLTTAFRRMLEHARRQSGATPSLAKRIQLLRNQIFGSDLSEPACRVTAFSLYLSLLEDLVPTDIALLTEDPELKLPELIGKTLHAGDTAGEFFSSKNPLAGRQQFTIFLSNPPWQEPDGNRTALPYERWMDKNHRVTARRQIAGAFAHRALSCVQPKDGLVVLILPISLLLAPTSLPFVQNWLLFAQPKRMVNFGDLRRQLFAAADHGCAVVVARPRNTPGLVPPGEAFDYWSPKVDVSLAFGRLTLHTGDRHTVRTQSCWEDNGVLRILAWGGHEDQALITRLRLEGCVGDLVSHRDWALIKGFNQTRHSSPPLPPKHLARMQYLDAMRIPREGPVVPDASFSSFPKAIKTVVSYGSNEGQAFYGPRVLFPDGLSSQLEMRASYTDQDACFKHTVCAICPPDKRKDASRKASRKEANLLRFLAAYLRSKLASYLILHTAYSPANERERITVNEVKDLPFVHPDDHIDQRSAWEIVNKVAELSRTYQDEINGVLSSGWDRDEAEAYIGRYFGLTDVEQDLVKETVDWALPSRQQGGSALFTPWQQPPSRTTVNQYVSHLKLQLDQWRDKLGGKGSFEVSAKIGTRDSRRGVGIVQIRLVADPKLKKEKVDNVDLKGVQAVIDALAQKDLLPMAVGENLFLASDFLIVTETAAYLIKPLANRLWRPSQSATDVRRLVDKAARRQSR